MTKETRTPEPLYHMDLCQGAFLIEINDPAGFRLGQLIAMDLSTSRFASILHSQLGLAARLRHYGSLPGSDLIVARTRNDANLQFISNSI